MPYITTENDEGKLFATQKGLKAIGTRDIANGPKWLEWEGILTEIEQQELISLGGKYYEGPSEYILELSKYQGSEVIQ